MATALSRLSFGKTAITLALACVMITCSYWQRNRYYWKVELVKTYKANSSAPAPEFPGAALANGPDGKKSSVEAALVSSLRFKKVSLRGTFDYDRQIIVTNRRDVSGPGHYLIAPFHLEGSDKTVLVSRGFIPFENRNAESWTQWNFPQPGVIEAVVQECLSDSTFGPSNPPVGTPENPERLWFYEECGKIAQQLPYPIIGSVFVQQLGGAPVGEFPKEAVSIQIPPSTHFGYMIEWALLAFVTLLLGIGLQLVPLHPLAYARRPQPESPPEKLN